MLKKCANINCNEMFESVTNKQFCSRACVKAHRRIKKIEISCQHCGKTLLTSINYKHRRFCSPDCNSKAKNPSKISFCRVCGVELSAIHTSRGYKYCSKECRHVGVKRVTLNEHYFDVIDTYDKAYWLGFLFADGCNTGKDIVIGLKDTDISVLEQFKLDIESNVVIKHLDVFNKSVQKIIHSERLCVSSPIMCNALRELGMVKCKSKILKFPNIETKFLSSFIRGVFDGDGCFHIKSRTSRHGLDASFSIYSASPDFLIGLQNAFSLFGINIGIRSNSVITGDLKLIKRICEFLYDENCNRRLERKYEKYKKWLDSRK